MSSITIKPRTQFPASAQSGCRMIPTRTSMFTMSSSNFPESRPGLGLNLLCLDGGGVRGLSSLYILKQLMESINLESPPKPCQIFDMIGGTSTGGLIAIMLGRLEMSVDDCIEAYRAMSPKIFTKVNHRLNLRGKVQGRFDHTAIEESVKNILREHHLPEDEKFYQPSKHGSKTCMTFVCATSKQTGKTVVFSSYPSARRGRSLLDRATIWQVARATSAATSFFDPVEIGDEEFVDGATPANNPIAELWSEAYEVFSNVDATWSLEDNGACVVSIGTGVPMLRPFGDDPLSIGAKLVKIATDTEKAAEDFARHHPRLVREGRYFRFNVQKGLETVGLEEQAKHKEIISSTRFYTQTQDVQKSMMGCAEALTKSREFLKYIEFDDMHTRRNQVGVALGGTTEWIKTHPAFEEWSDEAAGILWIQGKPGSGKSVLAKSIIEMIQQAGPSNLLTASWFYSKRGGDVGMSHISMMRSICYQLLSQNRQLFQACAGIYRQRGDVMERLSKIMEAIFGHVDSPAIICLLDGLDESADRDGKRGRDMLERLVQLVDNPGSKAKIIVLSRLYSSIEEAYGTYDILLEAENGSDIEKIVDSGMSSLVEAMESKKSSSNSSFASRRRQKIMDDRRQAYNNSPGPELDEVARKQEMLGIRTYLIDRAQGVTLWVTLCIDQAARYVSKGPCTWATIRRMLASLPLQVTEMYVLITTELAQECGSEHIRMARKVLAWVIAASGNRPFLVRELFDAVSIPDGWEEPQLENCWQSNRDPITTDHCVTPGPTFAALSWTFAYDRLANVTDGSVVQLVHQTAKDFLETTEAHVFALKPGEAQQVLETDSDLYFQLVIPMQITCYAPVLDDVSSDWRKTVVEMVEYLDDKHLLPFILTYCRLGFEKYRNMATSPDEARWMLSTFFYDMSYRDTDVEGVLEQTVVGSCFILACKRGMQTAVDNLLYLSSLRPSWWRIHKRAVISACWRVGKSQKLSAVARLLENHRPPRYTPARRDGGTYNPEKLLWLKHSENYSPEAEKLLLEGPEAGRVSPDAGDIRIPAGVYNEDEVLFRKLQPDQSHWCSRQSQELCIILMVTLSHSISLQWIG
ncbi:hypothetical protein V8F06_012262 [Rhypophila decipiens]